MPEDIETGFDELLAAIKQGPQPEIPWHHDMTAEERRQAEMAEGQRQVAKHAVEPQAPHPSQQIDPDAAAQQYAKEAVQSEAARINAEIYARIAEARRAPEPPPPPAQPVAPQISRQTQLEMEAGRRASARAAAERVTRTPVPKTAREIASEGATTTVFNPDLAIPKEVFAALPNGSSVPGIQPTSDVKRGYSPLG